MAACLPTAGTGDGSTAISGLRFRFAPPPSGHDGDELIVLTNRSVRSAGADQIRTSAVRAHNHLNDAFFLVPKLGVHFRRVLEACRVGNH